MLENTHSGFCIAFVCGAPGSGKSFICVRDVIKRLIDSDRRLVTNLPLEVDEIAQYVAARRKCEPAEVVERITLIPTETLSAWKQGLGAPGNTFSVEDSRGADLILDECHLFCPKKGVGAAKVGKSWTDWLGEARHGGWGRLVFVTQDESKVGEPITSHAEMRFELTNAERLRDPWFRIPLGDWFELRGSFAGQYRSSVSVSELRRTNGKMKFSHRTRVQLDPEFFKFYRSHQVAGGGSAEGQVQRELRECEKRGRFFSKLVAGRRVTPVWRWFLRRHSWRFALAFGLVASVLWTTIGGGSQVLIGWWMGSFKHIAAANAGDDARAVERKAAIAGEVAPVSDALAGLSADKRALVEKLMTQAATELRQREETIKALEKGVPTLDVPAETLPVVSAFVGGDRAVVDGRVMKAGDFILLDGGLRRVRIRRIDRLERVVWLEDERILRFAVGAPVAVQLPFSGGPGVSGSAGPAAARGPVQSLGGSPGGGPTPRTKSPREKTIVQRPENGPLGVLPPGGG